MKGLSKNRPENHSNFSEFAFLAVLTLNFKFDLIRPTYFRFGVGGGLGALEIFNFMKISV